MKRYFTFANPPDPKTYRAVCFYHYLALPSGGHIGVLLEESAPVPSDWTELPHLLEGKAAGLKDHGCAPTDTTYQAAKKLAAINKHFHP
jgi:hypothetical protein